ncbi:MAG: hypothetical protein WBZ14_12830, partial [Terriglobales bacterium]
AEAVPFPKADVLKLCRVLDGAEPRHHTSSFSASCESHALSKQIQTDPLRSDRLLPRQARAEALAVAVNYAV